jgi:glycosyltransferase involved in cell wall biosynthesis
MLVMQHQILADGSWNGTHGIGRFSHEVLSRLSNADILTPGPNPLSLYNLYWLPYQLNKHKKTHKVFFNPGFNPILHSPIPYVATIHDLIHLYLPGNIALGKKIYYETLIKYTVKQAHKIITVSEYSKQNIIEWSKISEDKIVVVGNGISKCFTAEGDKYEPGYPYLLNVGNTKTHKNIHRLIEAFASAKLTPEMKLILTGQSTPEIQTLIQKLQLNNRIVFSGILSDEKLAEYYRGATAFVLPSLFEGFGIPIIEAMACGTPALVSNITSLPEVAGDAAVIIDPYQIDSIAQGLEKISLDKSLQQDLIQKGFIQANLFSWDKTASKIQTVLNEAI